MLGFYVIDIPADDGISRTGGSGMATSDRPDIDQVDPAFARAGRVNDAKSAKGRIALYRVGEDPACVDGQSHHRDFPVFPPMDLISISSGSFLEMGASPIQRCWLKGTGPEMNIVECGLQHLTHGPRG